MVSAVLGSLLAFLIRGKSPLPEIRPCRRERVAPTEIAATLVDNQVGQGVTAAQAVQLNNTNEWDESFVQAQWRMPSIVERALLYQDESVDPLDLLDRLDMATADREAATKALLAGETDKVLVNVPTLSKQQCTKLRNFLLHKIKDDGVDNVDGCPDWQININESKLAKIIGTKAVQQICALPLQVLAGKDENFVCSRLGIFLRMYQPSRRPWMPFHADGNAFTVNVALNDDTEFTGGRLMALYNKRLQVVDRQEGDATCHRGSVYHAVSAIRSGTRYSLIIFLHE